MGIEDPRITYVPELEQFAVAYTSFARGGPGVSLALATGSIRSLLAWLDANSSLAVADEL
jgi:predicted GH43/DUF377 family glycosyl hydrolase